MTAFAADSAALAAVVLRVARFVPETLGGRMPPVCKGILLTARGDGGLEVVATDLTAAGHGRLAADVTAPGRVLVGGIHLARIVRHLPAPDVAVATEGAHFEYVVITSGPACWRLITLPEEDFPGELPAGPDLDEVRPVAMDGHQLELTRGETFVSRIRPRRAARPPRVKDLYAPTGLDAGAWITWTRETADGDQAIVGQVWSAAPGAHAVWALAEGETAPAYVQPRYGTRRRRRPDLTHLTECPPPAAAAPREGTP